MGLDSDQQAAVELLTDTGVRLCIMTGGPGVGKTYTLNTVVSRLGGKVLLCSPTGKAAKRLAEATGREAKTIHGTLKGAPRAGFQHDASNTLDADVVVVDESSMVEAEMMAALMVALPPSCRLILVGDPNQLSPVGAGQPFTDLIRSGDVPVARLGIIHRQAGDSWVIDNANRIIKGKLPSVENTHDFTMLETPSDGIVEAAVDLLLADPTAVILTPQSIKGAGVLQINIAAQIAFLGPVAPGEGVITLNRSKIRGITCRKNDRVMVLRNMKAVDEGETERYLPNGVTGECIEVLGDFRGRFRFEGNEFTLGGDQINMTLAYAMTIHKSQGSGWDHVAVVADPTHKFFLEQQGRQLMYTAVTRVQERLTVIGSSSTFAGVAKGDMSNLRETYLKEFYPTGESTQEGSVL